MTIIEFFDKDAIENMVSTLVGDPDRVVLIGNKRKAMEKAAQRYTQVARRNGRKAEFLVRSVERNDLERIVAVLTQIVQTWDDCTFDLTGGEDLYLVGAGIVFQNCPGRLRLHRFNVHNEALYDCDADGYVLDRRQVSLSVEENIFLYDGRVIYAPEKKGGTRKWDLTPEFSRDVKTMWGICRADLRAWNKLITQAAEPEESPGTVAVKILYYNREQGLSDDAIPPMFFRLEEADLIHGLEARRGELRFSCKDAQVQACLTVAGLILELKTTLAMKESGQFGDILTGVSIDWDRGNDTDVENEIDVLAMKGLVPVFISCKNGTVPGDELYKLATVAERFGGKYARKALVATYELNEDIKRRAYEMRIRIIDKVGVMEDATFQRALANIVGELK